MKQQTRRELLKTAAASSALLFTGAVAQGARGGDTTATPAAPLHPGSLLDSAGRGLSEAELAEYERQKREALAQPKPLRAPLLPPALKEGSRIAVAAPASGVNERELGDGIAALERFGCKVVLGKLVNRRMNYLSAPDEARAEELNAMLNDDSIDAILCGRGGYGVMRMLPMVDFEAIRRNPKAVIGYSDITALVNAIYSLTGVAAFHGPVASSAFDAFTLKHFHSVLFSKKAAGTAEESSEFQEISIESSRASTIVHGVGRGRLVGGNLTLVTATLGTPYEIDTTGALLFLEEVSEEPYRIDRMLTQLWLAGKLQSCKAIAIGQFKNTEARRDPTFDVSYSLREVLETRFKPLGIPTVYGLPIGHIRSKLTVPIGVLAELDATAGRLTLLEPAVG